MNVGDLTERILQAKQHRRAIESALVSAGLNQKLLAELKRDADASCFALDAQLAACQIHRSPLP